MCSRLLYYSDSRMAYWPIVSLRGHITQVLHRFDHSSSYPSSLRCFSSWAAAVSRWVSSWRRVVPYLLVRLLYQVRVVRSVVAVWSATSFWILAAEHADGLGRGSVGG